MSMQKFLHTSHKPVKIKYFKKEKLSTANMQIFFYNSTKLSLNIVKILTSKIMGKISNEMRMMIMKLSKNICQQAIVKEVRIS